MSYSIDANILLYSVNEDADEHEKAFRFIQSRADDLDLLCLTWPTLMAFQRIATHPAIFRKPLTPAQAWQNISSLLQLPRSRIVTEEASFPEDYAIATKGLHIRGNLVPDAHLATLLRQHGIQRLYTTDSDFRKFAFLDVVNPLV